MVCRRARAVDPVTESAPAREARSNARDGMPDGDHPYATSRSLVLGEGCRMRAKTQAKMYFAFE